MGDILVLEAKAEENRRLGEKSRQMGNLNLVAAKSRDELGYGGRFLSCSCILGLLYDLIRWNTVLAPKVSLRVLRSPNKDLMLKNSICG